MVNSRLGQTEKRDVFMEKPIIYYRSCEERPNIIWAGHVWRSEGIRGNITRWRPDSKLRSERPRQRWPDRIMEDLRMIGIKNPLEISMAREIDSGMLLLWRWTLNGL